MELNPYDLALIAGGFTVLGALIGALVTYWLALQLAQKTARREAGRALREAFEPELAALDPEAGQDTINIEDLLKAAWPRHRAAVSELMFHLPSHHRIGLEKAWHDYYRAGGSIRFFDYYINASGQTGNPRDRFRRKVEAIFAFTTV